MELNRAREKGTLRQQEMQLYEELLDCLEEEVQALMSAREEAILAAAARKEALLDRLLEIKRSLDEGPPANAAPRTGRRLAHLQRRVAAANARNREIVVNTLEMIQEFLAQFQPPGPGLYRPGGETKPVPESALFKRQA
jgi:flagellar biosynthesis/type III secretory pathway chaperone